MIHEENLTTTPVVDPRKTLKDIPGETAAFRGPQAGCSGRAGQG